MDQFPLFLSRITTAKTKYITSHSVLVDNDCSWEQLWEVITVESRDLRSAIELLGLCNKILLCSWNYITKLFQFCF